jgi:glycosyltransferase involved in cell wall biosynthesis
MIGVHISAEESAVAAEFFELFKTPWEPLVPERTYDVALCTLPPPPWVRVPLLLVFGSGERHLDKLPGISTCSANTGGTLNLGPVTLPLFGQVRTFSLPEATSTEAPEGPAEPTAGFRIQTGRTTIVRLGYDLFKEVQHLLSQGQPAFHGGTPTLDLHIEALRRWMTDAGVSFVEVPPVQAGVRFAVCLTHDIDFIGLRQHRGDHTMWGFLYRATVGSANRFARGRISPRELRHSWGSAAMLPFVHLGWAKDYWLPFPWYLDAERGLPATYYIIPFKNRAGQHVDAPRAPRRATKYDVADIMDWIPRLREAGAEVAVHGIDAWHSIELGTAELNRIRNATGEERVGVRMHWLLSEPQTPQKLEAAGYDYDATHGYNDIPGFRAGTTQVYRPLGASKLLELPLHIQDGALFLASRQDLPESEAWEKCLRMIQHASAAGGVLSLLWHDRSHGPERYWGGFYLRLIRELRERPVWFATGRQVVDWFRARRLITFQRTAASVRARAIKPIPGHAFVLRLHRPGAASPMDTEWSGEGDVDLSSLYRSGSRADIADAVSPPERNDGINVRQTSPPPTTNAVKTVCFLVQNRYDIDIRVRRKAESLAAAGYGVDVIALRSGGTNEKTYQLNGVNVFTVSLGKNRGSLLRYAIEYFAFFAVATWKLSTRMHRRRYALIDVNNLPDFLVFAAIWAKLQGAKVVFDMHEITPEFYQSKYRVSEKTWLISFLKIIERLSIRFADHVITINEPISQLLLTRGLPADRTTIVMNAVDEALFAHSPATCRSLPAQKNGFVMMYHGTLTRIYGLDLAIEAFAKVRDRMQTAEFWIIGGGPERNALQILAARLGVSARVKFFDNVRPDEVSGWLAHADIGVLPTRRDVFLDLSFSNKLSEYIVMGKAVLCSNLRSLRSYFSDEAVLYFEANSSSDLAEQMLRLYNDAKLRRDLAEHATAEYHPIRWEVMRARYLALAANLTAPLREVASPSTTFASSS